MRITNGMMMKKYGRNLNSSLSSMNKTSQQVYSGRRFEKGSEDPARALKALQVRRSGDALEQFASNIDAVDSWLSQTETAVKAVKNSADKAVDLIIQGRNDPLADEDRKIIAANLRSIQEQLLKDLNSQVATKYLLGGANTKNVPFTVDADTGHLMFNGKDVFEADSIEDLIGDKDHVYVDLTGEFKLDDDGEIIDKSTVFDMFTAGVNIIGIGPNNLYNLIGRTADAFENVNMADIDGPIDAADDPDYAGETGLFKRLQDAQLTALIELVKVGEKSNFVTYLKQRNEDTLYDAQVMQNKLELIPADEAIMMLKMQDYVYKACLQMNSYILQPGLMDFLRR